MKIESLHLDFENRSDVEPGTTADEPHGFWVRQFRQEPTTKQKIFDWAYGVVVPLVCVVADPIVFTSRGMLGTYRPFAYLVSAASILAMAAWLLWGKKIGGLAAPLAGFFIAGSGVSLIVGVLLFPYSLIGLFFVIGFLGFTPLFSALVFLRNGVRALRTSRSTLDRRVVWQGAVIAAVFGLVVPYVVNVQVSHLVSEVAAGDLNTIRRESAKLMYIKPLVDAGPIADRYYQSDYSEKSSPRMKALVRVYEELTGENIEVRVMAD